MKKNIGLIIAILLIIILLGYVITSNIVNATRKIENPIVTMEVENFGEVKIELYPDMAPNTVANFINLIEAGYYDGLTFHRAVDGFMIQGGDKEGTGSGKTDETIEGEFLNNGYEKNTLRHDRGVISMARSDYSSLGLTKEGYNSAYSQFFIMTDNNESVNGNYAGFGKVIEGMEIIDKIAKVEEIQEKDTQAQDETEEEKTDKSKYPKITKMTVDTFGVKYKEPKRQKAFDINSYLMKLYGLSI